MHPPSFIQIVNASDAQKLSAAVKAYNNPQLVIVNGELHWHGEKRDLSDFWRLYRQTDVYA